MKGEAESAYLIDFDYAKSPNWAVIHDLRLEFGGRVAQIDHLLINRWMDVYVLETKHFHAGLKITEEGEFLRWNDFRKSYEGMPSPLEQNERHIAVLRDAMSKIELPERLGLRIAPSFNSFVLVSPSARITRSTKFDASRVIKADQLKKNIWKDIEGEGVFTMLKTVAKIVSGETVEYVAKQIAELHSPLSSAGEADKLFGTPKRPIAPFTSTRERIEPTFQPQSASNSKIGAACKDCRGANGSVLYGKFGYYFKCAACETNTAIRFSCQPGHSPRLRKEGLAFFRECTDCGSSEMFHLNSDSEASK
jgi:hypothetical protein